MEKIIIHDLQKYKLVLNKEESINTSFKGDEKSKTNLGLETKLFNILSLTPLEGWTEVRNPEIVFQIADDNRLKVSSELLKRIKPSSAFFEKRKKLKSKETKSQNKKKKKQPKLKNKNKKNN